MAYYAYLVELERPLGGRQHSARYYLGIARDTTARLLQHRQGKGARMLAAAALRGIRFSIVKIWPFASYRAAREFELWAKRSLKNHRKLL